MSDKSEEQYVWVVRAPRFSNGVLVDRYKAKAIRETSVTVYCYSGEKCIRKAYDTHFFREKAEVIAFVKEFLRKRLAVHEEAIAEIKEQLEGDKLTYHEVPSEAVKHGELKF